MIEVYCIPVPKDRLRSIPKEERVLLLLLGYGANQLSMLQKLLIFSTNKVPSHELEQYLSGAQTQMILRLIIGTLHETWLLVTRRFTKSHIAKDYHVRLGQGGQQALNKLNRQFGASNLLNKIRNNFSFHYPDTDAAEAAFEAACNDTDLDDHWKLYFSQHGYNSFFFLSDLIIAHGINEAIGGTDLITAQQTIMDEVSSAVENLFVFSKAFTAAVWLTHFGSEMLAQDVATISDACKLEDVWIPFFVDLDISAETNTTIS